MEHHDEYTTPQEREFDYACGNISVAAWLVARGYPVRGLRERGRRPGESPWIELLFPGAAEPDALLYFRGGSCGARALMAAQRDVRTMVMDHKQANHSQR
jgi:hypothetical protein